MFGGRGQTDWGDWPPGPNGSRYSPVIQFVKLKVIIVFLNVSYIFEVRLMKISQSQSYNLKKCSEVTKIEKTKSRKCIENQYSTPINY